MSDMKLKHQLALGFGLLLAALAAALFLAQAQLRGQQARDDDAAAGRLIQAGQLALAGRAQDAGAQLVLRVAGLLAGGDGAQWRAEQPRVDAALEAAMTGLSALTAHAAGDGKPLLEAAREAGLAVRGQIADYRRLAAAAHGDEARIYLRASLWPAAQKYQEAVGRYARFESEQSLRLAAAEAGASSGRAADGVAVAGAALAALAVALYWLLARALERQLGGDPRVLAMVLRELAGGEVRTAFNVRDGDDSSPFAFLRAAVSRSLENMRLRSALDVCTTNVMIADGEHQVVYANRAALDMFQQAEADIRQELPQFSARAILGCSIDSFHRNPSFQRGLLQDLRGTHRGTIKVGGRTFHLVLTPILDGQNRKLGAVVEWVDATRELERKAEEDARLAADRLAAAENARIRSALDVCTTNVMIADAEHKIIYANGSALAMFRNAEPDIRKDIPSFSASRLLGSSIDEFHKNPGYQRGLLAQARDTHRSSIAVGGRTFGLILSPVVGANGERLGSVVEWQDNTEMLRLQQEAQQRMDQERAQAAENARIRNALDNCTTNVMIADNERRIIYMNHSVTDMLRSVEADLRKALPHFDVRRLLGTSIDEFHKNPAHQRELLANMRATYRAEIVVAGRTFSLVSNPVFGADGARLGSVVEWKDRTAEVEIEREVAGIVSAASAGEFGKRIDVEGKQGFFRLLSEGVNQLMGVTSQGLADIAGVLGALAGGDLTRSISADYQGLFGQLKADSNATVDKLKEIVANIKDSTDTINTAAREIAAGNANLSSRTEQQAASLEETASSMEEITSTVRQNAENARKANSLAIGASDIAARGGKVVGDVVSTMNEINDSAKKIVDIISVIDGIAFQTNILALNAAVEAARAGEQGRGFAVVASEVRSLAQRSAAAAKEIKLLIGDSVDKVESGSRLVDEAGRTMDEIVVSIRRVADIMSDISAASAEQSSGIEQVNLAVTQMDENTQKNAALVEQAAAAAESLEEQARYLSGAVAVFRLDESGRSGQPPQARPLASRQPAAWTFAAKGRGPARALEPIRPPRDADDGTWEEF
ncbi:MULTISPECIES: methyl-accepting chemotaxis protein [Chromobacterium]|nr:methyl-accepting chemotaxis protein [Chromobacterium subtsugae]WSE93030.1 methyl-accepting chemotaxis protein [Chromobacterium subtsugae]WVH61408.1 methyl-accepting chemotaxis protein [Chromobacterium subtsugae]